MTRYLREPVSAITHFLGALLAAAGLIWLIFNTYPQVDRVVVASIYGGSTIVTFLASTIMHLYKGDKNILRWLIRIDHAAIYLMIAGTYTPVAYLFLDSVWFWSMMLTIWGMALVGATWKLSYWKEDSIWSMAYYLVMGWLCVLMVPQFLPHLDVTGGLLFLAGGLMYSAGAAVFVLQRPNFNRWWGYHEVWHMFVLAGAGLHFFALVHYLV